MNGDDTSGHNQDATPNSSSAKCQAEAKDSLVPLIISNGTQNDSCDYEEASFANQRDDKHEIDDVVGSVDPNDDLETETILKRIAVPCSSSITDITAQGFGPIDHEGPSPDESPCPPVRNQTVFDSLSSSCSNSNPSPNPHEDALQMFLLPRADNQNESLVSLHSDILPPKDKKRSSSSLAPHILREIDTDTHSIQIDSIQSHKNSETSHQSRASGSCSYRFSMTNLWGSKPGLIITVIAVVVAIWCSIVLGIHAQKRATKLETDLSVMSSKLVDLQEIYLKTKDNSARQLKRINDLLQNLSESSKLSRNYQSPKKKKRSAFILPRFDIRYE